MLSVVTPVFYSRSHDLLPSRQFTLNAVLHYTRETCNVPQCSRDRLWNLDPFFRRRRAYTSHGMLDVSAAHQALAFEAKSDDMKACPMMACSSINLLARGAVLYRLAAQRCKAQALD